MSAPVRVGDVVAARCSCGESFRGTVQGIQDFGPGGPALAFITHVLPGCGSTRCVAVCRCCGAPVEFELERCGPCRDEALLREAVSA